MNVSKPLLFAALLACSGAAMATDPFYAVCNTCNIATPTPDGDPNDMTTTIGMLNHLRSGNHWSFQSWLTMWVCNGETAAAAHDGSGCANYVSQPDGSWVGNPSSLPDTLCEKVFKHDPISAPCTFPDPGDTWHGTPPPGFTFDVIQFGGPVYWCMGRLGCELLP